MAHPTILIERSNGHPHRENANKSTISGRLLDVNINFQNHHFLVAAARPFDYVDFMGASGWSHFVPYEPDIAQALGKLRESVFRSGTFYGSKAAKKSKTIAELLERNGASGTHSILDVDRIVQTPLPVPVLKWYSDVVAKTGTPPPQAEFQERMLAETKCMRSIAPLSDEQLATAFGTNRPTRNVVEMASYGLHALIPRGCGIYIVIYDGSNYPSEIFFMGKTGD